VNAEKVIIWVKWAPNLASFAAAFCSLRTHARQGSTAQRSFPGQEVSKTASKGAQNSTLVKRRPRDRELLFLGL